MTIVEVKMRGFSYPFQEAIYWLNRNKKNTNAQSLKIVKKLYSLGITLVMLPGGDDDDYAEQLYVLVSKDNKDDIRVSMKDMFQSAVIVEEYIESSDGELAGTFLVADWSSSAKTSDRFFRNRSE
jgi:hypothetical protein